MPEPLADPTLDARIRLWIYRHFIDRGGAPSVLEIAAAHDIALSRAVAALRRLAAAEAVVLVPGSCYLWMAEPFSALPTAFRVVAGAGRSWWGNCIWDALAILALLDRDGRVETACPRSGVPLEVRVAGGALATKRSGAVVHFSVPARDWWRDIGFT